MKTRNWMLLTSLIVAGSLHAGPRTSASYTVATDSADAGGKRATSASYTNDGSIGGITGISTAAAPEETAKQGYIGQLYEVTALNLASAPTIVNETLTRQLSGEQLLDDSTTIAVPAASITWSILSGPLTGISTGGLATAGAVYQNTAASVQGSYAGDNGALGLTVLDTIADNFGTYAADGLGDDWQVQYFGLGNPNAGPLVDPDHDGHNNHFEFTAGIVPTDPHSVFRFRIAPVPGQPGQKNLIFSPRLADRTYIVRASTLSPAGTFLPLGSSSSSDNGTERTVTDLNAGGARKFYQVEIVKP